MTHPDIEALEALTEGVLNPGPVVRKDVEHDANGRIRRVLERHQPFRAEGAVREFGKLLATACADLAAPR